MVWMKRCSKCGVAKETTFFSKDPAQKSGLHPACKACKIEAHRRRMLDPEKLAKSRERSRLANQTDSARAKFRERREKINASPDAVEARRAYMREDYRKRMSDPAYRMHLNERAFRRKYGIGYAERDALLSSQNGRCAICGLGNQGRPWHLDHCHATDRVRGILCHFCNTSLGMIRESEATALAMAAYIRKHAT